MRMTHVLLSGPNSGSSPVNLLVDLRHLYGRGSRRVGDLHLARVIFAVGLLAEQHHDARLWGIGHDVGVLDEPAVDELVVGDAAHAAVVGEFRDISRPFAGIRLGGAVIEIGHQETAAVFSLVVDQTVAFGVARRDEFYPVDLLAVVTHRQVEEMSRIVDARTLALEDTPRSSAIT